jgi:hypothetical protein
MPKDSGLTTTLILACDEPKSPPSSTGSATESDIKQQGENALQIPVVIVTEHTEAGADECPHEITVTEAEAVAVVEDKVEARLMEANSLNAVIAPEREDQTPEISVDYLSSDVEMIDADTVAGEGGKVVIESENVEAGKLIKENNAIDESEVIDRSKATEETKVVDESKTIDSCELIEENKVINKGNIIEECEASEDADVVDKSKVIDQSKDTDKTKNLGPGNKLSVEEHPSQAQEGGSDGTTTQKTETPSSSKQLVSAVSNVLKVIACEAGDLPIAMAGLAHQEAPCEDEDSAITARLLQNQRTRGMSSHGSSVVSEKARKGDDDQFKPNTFTADTGDVEQHEADNEPNSAYSISENKAMGSGDKISSNEAREARFVHVPQDLARSSSGSTPNLLYSVVRDSTEDGVVQMTTQTTNQEADKLVNSTEGPHNPLGGFQKEQDARQKPYSSVVTSRMTDCEICAQKVDIGRPQVAVELPKKPRPSVSFSPIVPESPLVEKDVNSSVKSLLVRVGTKLRIPSYARSTKLSKIAL